MMGVPTEAVYAMDAALQKHAIYLGRVTIAELLAAVAPLIARAERMRCAAVCSQLRHPNYSAETEDWCDGTQAAAAAIRALGDEG